MEGHVGYYAVFTVLALLEIISAGIAIAISAKTIGLARKIRDKGLLRLGIGYAVMSIALIIGFAASLIALLYPANPVLVLEERREHMGLHHPEEWRHGPWPGDRFGVSWNLVLLAGIFFPVSYAVILYGLSSEYVRLEEGGRAQEKYLSMLVTPGLLTGMISDMVSIGILIGIIVIARKGGGGIAPYIVFLAAHVLRLAGEAAGMPILFLIGEMLRPIALLIVLGRVMLR